MTVKELIEKLSKLPPDAKVFIEDREYRDWEVENIDSYSRSEIVLKG